MGLTIIYLALLVRIALLPGQPDGECQRQAGWKRSGPSSTSLARMPEAGRRKDLMRQLL
ncbi:MAG: hypothetical protein WKG07_23945 [Hymenobacter sp.]